MPQQSSSTQTATQGTTQHTGSVTSFDGINEPGTYIFNSSGQLLRVPPDAIAPGRSPLMNIVGREQIIVTQISDDPFIPLTKARLLASNLDVNVNF